MINDSPAPKKKIGVTLPLDLHATVKSQAPLRGLNVEQAYEQALLQWLAGGGQAQGRDAGQFSPKHLSWHEKLEFILQHGDSEDLVGIHQNLTWAVNDIRSHPRKAGSRRKTG